MTFSTFDDMAELEKIRALLAHKELFIFDLDGTLFNTLGDLAPAVNYAMTQFGLRTHSNATIRVFIGNGSMNLIRRAVAANFVNVDAFNIRNIDGVAAVLEREGFSEERVKEIHQVYSDFYWEHCTENTVPYEGVVELLQRISSNKNTVKSSNMNGICGITEEGDLIESNDCTGEGAETAQKKQKKLSEHSIKRAAMLTNKPIAPAQKILKKFGLQNSFTTYLCGDTTPERKPSPAGICEILRLTGTAPENAIMIGDDTPDVLAAKNAGIDCITLLEGFGKRENLLPLNPRYTATHIKDFSEFI